ncbi:MAG: hypothetical protein JEZ00_12685 [Anaerolineaceae bacterium]|nr:hypothetical protein [Anaerolineaceae bacterium]
MNAIESRKSVRNFQQSPLRDSDIQKIQTYLNKPENRIGPHGNQIKLKLLLGSALNNNEKIATYGIIKNAQGYLLGSCINTAQAVFDFSFVFEGLILYLTESGIGTCWLGGTFKRQEILQYFPLNENEIIPAISPLGYAMDNKHFKERMMRQFIKADRRKSADQLFFCEDFTKPLTNQAEVYQQPLEYIRIAPSAKNNQPWRIVVSKDLSKVHFYILNKLQNEKAFACAQEILDIGIAYRHFVSGMAEQGIQGQLISDDPGIEMVNEMEYIGTWMGE